MNLKQITQFDRYFFILKKMHCKRIHSLFQYPKSNIILRLSVQRQSLSVFNEQIWSIWSIKLYMVVARYSYLYGTVIFFVSFWGWSYHLLHDAGHFGNCTVHFLLGTTRRFVLKAQQHVSGSVLFISFSTKLIIFFKFKCL